MKGQRERGGGPSGQGPSSHGGEVGFYPEMGKAGKKQGEALGGSVHGVCPFRAMWYLCSLIIQQTFVEHCYVPGMVLDSGMWYERTSQKPSLS